MTMTVLHWNRLSDRLGRKPLLLMGMCGSITSMLCFGLSQTFWGLVTRYTVEEIPRKRCVLTHNTQPISLGAFRREHWSVHQSRCSFYNFLGCHRSNKECCGGNYRLDESAERFCVDFRFFGGRGKSRVRSSPVFLPHIYVTLVHI